MELLHQFAMIVETLFGKSGKNAITAEQMLMDVSQHVLLTLQLEQIGLAIQVIFLVSLKQALLLLPALIAEMLIGKQENNVITPELILTDVLALAWSIQAIPVIQVQVCLKLLTILSLQFALIVETLSGKQEKIAITEMDMAAALPVPLILDLHAIRDLLPKRLTIPRLLFALYATMVCGKQARNVITEVLILMDVLMPVLLFLHIRAQVQLTLQVQAFV